MECLTISGIPNSIENRPLDGNLLNLFRKVNVFTDRSNVEHFHRFRSKSNAPQKVIIKLSKRKNDYRILKAKPSFKNADVTKNGIPTNTPIFVNQILCSYYKFLWSKCKKRW